MELTYIGCVEKAGVLGGGGAGWLMGARDSTTNMCIHTHQSTTYSF